jgi:hypothetical protein
MIIDTMKFADKIIRNIEFPACKNCIHYRQSPWTNDFTGPYNKCEQFGTKDIVTDKVTYDYAELCRIDERLCGKQGKYFKKDPLLLLKKLKHKIFRPITFLYSIPIIYLVAYHIVHML